MQNSFPNQGESYRFALKISTNMFEQYTASGANLFIAIVAVLAGFAAALGYLDFLKTKKDEKKG